ncbi:hypothetical protein HBI24_176200 [Parastagonospora nodorum]|nr:hypothetical protein HBI09_220590 [Parastagonospora nodorum]KAH4042715.1 hypothetical protein HBH49_244190 [Parastagonospora nodorum]KAH4185761.1 hypothetical protein HBH42_176350 [Parastagonospora nodorum]KAH4842021.1 hypothetical protein HBH75_218900 [Parastagonospora nodorum]KAH4982035.1 hypothetical protein HBI76_163970 [Parastagonospora nodorum]
MFTFGVADPGRPFGILQRKLEGTLECALRVYEFKDKFSATRQILQTVTRDPETEHVRSIKPGEEVESMWNGLGRTVEAILVDGLLFPQGADGEMVDNLFRNDPSAKKIFEQGGSIDIRKFANDLDMENEPMDDNEFEMYTDSELDGEQLAALEDDDGDSDWDIDDESSIVGPSSS